jgi:predicted RNA-binding protein with PIN domain
MAYLVDGHNLLGQTPGLSLSDPADRRRLVAAIGVFARARRCSVTVWFDGEPPGGARDDVRLGGVRVRHSGARRSADDALLEEIRRSRRPAELTLVTSDRSLYEKGRHLGARALAGHRFREMLAAAAVRSGASKEKPDRPDPEEVDYFLGVFEGGSDESRSSRRR